MTLKNEIFEGLGAATAAQKLVYDPRDDYYEQRAAYAKAENQRRQEERDEVKSGSAAGIAAAAARKAASASASASGVPTAASSQTPNMPTVPGVSPVPPVPQFDPSQAVAPGNVPQDAAGGMIKPQAIKLRFRPGGPVPRDSDLDDDPDDTDDEIDEMERRDRLPSTHGEQDGTPRHPSLSRPDDRALIREPFNADEIWPDGWEGSPEDDPDFDYGTPRHPHAFQRGGAVEDENPADALVKQFLAQSGADILLNRQRDFQMRNTTGVGDRDNRAAPLPPTDEQQRIADESGSNSRARQGVLPVAPPSRPTPPSAEDQDRAGYESGPNSRARLGVLPVAPPSPASVEGSPVIPSYQPRPLGGTDTTGVEGSPNIVPPLAAYTPPRLTGTVDQTPEARRSPYPAQATEDDASRIADEGVPNTRARRGNEPPPALDSTEFSAQAGYPEAVTTSRAGRALDALTTPSARVKALTALNGPEMELRQRRAQVNPGLFEQVTPQEQQRRQAEVDDIDRQLADIDKQREAIQRGQVSPPVGAGAGVAPGRQQAAAAPGTSSPSPQGTTTPPAPPPGAAAANTPSTAPKNEGYQRFQPTERMAMRPDAPDWNALGMDLRAPAGAPSGAPSGRGGGAAGPPARLSMSDPNRIAAFDPTPGGADMTDPTRRYTTTELAQAMVGAVRTAQLGPNGELPVVGDKAISRPVGQQMVKAYSQNGALEPGEAALAGMMGMYRVLLKQNRIPEANQLAYGIMQYANLEASSHAYVAADRVRAGDFGGALRNVAAAAMWLPDGMKHEVGPDGRSIITKDYSGKVTAVTPVDGRWLLAAIEGFKNGDLLWQTLSAAADHLKATDKNAEGRELGHEIQRNTIALQRQRLGKGAAGPKGAAALTEPERKLRALAASVSGVPTPQPLPLPALGGGDENVDAAQQYPTGYDYNEPSAPP